MSKKKSGDEQLGTVFYYDTWLELADDPDYSDEDIGKLFVATLRFAKFGEKTEFPDRAMRCVYNGACRAVRVNKTKYAERCLKNAYNAYCGIMKQANKDPVSFEVWQERQNINSGERQQAAAIGGERQQI